MGVTVKRHLQILYPVYAPVAGSFIDNDLPAVYIGYGIQCASCPVSICFPLISTGSLNRIIVCSIGSSPP